MKKNGGRKSRETVSLNMAHEGKKIVRQAKSFIDFLFEA
jgi:hypothetical protein